MKIKVLFLAIIVVSFLACNSQQKEMEAAIGALEEKVDSIPTAEEYSSLALKYEEYVKKYPQHKELSARYLYRAAGIHFRASNHRKAIELLDKSLTEYGESSNTPNSMLLKATILNDRLADRSNATKLFLDIIAKYPDHEAAKTAQKSMPELESVKRQMKKMEEVVYNDSLKTKVTNRSMMKLVEAYEVYTLLQPQDSLAPEYLRKGAEFAQTANAFPKAVELLSRITENYPKYEKLPQVLFLQGFIYENGLKELENAKIVYEDFMKSYPKHDLAPSVEFSLKNLGKSTEEIIKSFDKNKEPSK